MEILDLSEFFKTKAEAIDFSQRLSIVAQKIFETNFNLEKILMEQLGLHRKEKFVSLMRENNVNLSSNSALKDFITLIQSKISYLPVLSITLAFEPTAQTLQALSDWFLLNKKQVLFEISVDRNLLAGVAIYYNSKYLDFSIKSRFEKILNDTIYKKEENQQITNQTIPNGAIKPPEQVSLKN